VRGYPLLEIKSTKDEFVFHLECPENKRKCPNCGSRNVILNGNHHRRWRGLQMGKQPAWITMDVPRVRCRDCSKARQVKVSFADEHRRYTRAFEEFVLSLLQYMTCNDVAEWLGLCWDTVRDIEKANLKSKYSRLSLANVRRIAIDEIAVRKGHKYLTVVLDLDTGRAIFVGDGKDQEALIPFWKRLRRSRAKIEGVCTDMSTAYRAAVREHLPDAIHVFDRFHIVKLFNEKLTALRRRLYSQTKDAAQRDALKGSRFLLLKRRENLDDTHDESARLEAALAVSADLAVGYVLKEQLGELWESDGEDEAMLILRDWLYDAEWSKIPEMVSFADTLRTHWFEILNYHTCPLTSGQLEGFNNKIKTLKRQAYGFRDLEYFKLKILGLHQAKHALVG
jgi:transposase